MRTDTLTLLHRGVAYFHCVKAKFSCKMDVWAKFWCLQKYSPTKITLYNGAYFDVASAYLQMRTG